MSKEGGGQGRGGVLWEPGGDQMAGAGEWVSGTQGTSLCFSREPQALPCTSLNDARRSRPCAVLLAAVGTDQVTSFPGQGPGVRACGPPVGMLPRTQVREGGWRPSAEARVSSHQP